MSDGLERALLDEYRLRTEENQRQLTLRIQQAEQADPQIARLIGMRRGLFAGAVAEAARDIGAGRQKLEAARAEAMKIEAELQKRLAALGFEKDHLRLRFACPICEDSGFVGELKREKCVCHNRALMQRRYQAANLPQAQGQTFEAFDLSRFPDEPLEGHALTQRAYMARAKTLALDYCEAFPAHPKPDMLLTGPSGLGKTFLLRAMVRRVLDKGETAALVTAFELTERMRAHHRGDGSLDDLMRVPLLALDDLGTEPMFENVSIPYLYSLINHRQSAGLGTIVATNLTPGEIKARYTERIFSRLFDASRSIRLQFYGKDIRF